MSRSTGRALLRDALPINSTVEVRSYYIGRKEQKDMTRFVVFIDPPTLDTDQHREWISVLNQTATARYIVCDGELTVMEPFNCLKCTAKTHPNCIPRGRKLARFFRAKSRTSSLGECPRTARKWGPRWPEPDGHQGTLRQRARVELRLWIQMRPWRAASLVSCLPNRGTIHIDTPSDAPCRHAYTYLPSFETVVVHSTKLL